MPYVTMYAMHRARDTFQETQLSQRSRATRYKPLSVSSKSYKCSTNCILKRADQVIQGPRKWCDSIQLIIGHFPSLDCSNKSLFCPISNMLPLTNLQCTPLPVTLRSSPSFDATVDGDFLHHLHEVIYTHFRHEISQI